MWVEELKWMFFMDTLDLTFVPWLTPVAGDWVDTLMHLGPFQSNIPNKVSIVNVR